MQYVRKLGFEESPDYEFLRELFDKAIQRKGETDDGVYDWMLLNGGKGYEVKNKKNGKKGGELCTPRDDKLVC